MTRETMVFAGSPLDRVSNQRRDEAWVQQALADERSCFLPLHELNFPVTDMDPAQLFWGDRSWLEKAQSTVEPVLLGFMKGRAHFAFDATGLAAPDDAFEIRGIGSFHGLRAVVPRLSMEEAAIAAQARSMLDWHARHRFCAVCGAATRATGGGTSRKCPDCEADHFPRIDPVAIVVVTHGDRCLLGRSGRFVGNMYSALAGFIEPGESIEEAVRREVQEEAGIEVGAVRYVASQPWPFPSSLMIGCIAEAASEDIVIDEEELEDVRWFERAHIIEVLAGRARDISVPQPLAIARHLVQVWVDGD